MMVRPTVGRSSKTVRVLLACRGGNDHWFLGGGSCYQGRVAISHVSPERFASSLSTTAQEDRHPYCCSSRQKEGSANSISSMLGTLKRQFASSSSSTHTTAKTKPTKKKKTTSTPAAVGRVVWSADSTRKKTKAPKVCSGCGVELISSDSLDSGSSSHSKKHGNTIQTGQEASSRGSKKGAYADVLDRNQHGGLLCERCRTLRTGNIDNAYDALKDVSPAVFTKQLGYIVNRRRFGLCIKVVDAADFEGSIVQGIRKAIGGTPVVVAINKVDLLPRVSDWELRYMKRRIQNRGLNCVAVHAVSAKTGQGVVELAEDVLKRLGGRDVFVVGAANVGKSSLVQAMTSLLSESLYYRGTSKQAMQRKELLRTFQPTISHLPGTTLQAIRIPCFESSRHALWDTPGVINDASLSYHVFPPHLMEPLARPGRIKVRDPVRVRAGQSVLLEASWMQNCDDEENNPLPVLARLDVKSVERFFLEVSAFCPPCIGVRVMDTDSAPDQCIIPSSIVEDRAPHLVTKGDDLVKNLESFVEVRSSAGGESARTGRDYSMDIAFTSLGWLAIFGRGHFVLDPKCVKLSRYYKREPRMYPPHIFGEKREDDKYYDEHLDNNHGEIRGRLQQAARWGKDDANHRQL